MTELSPTTIKRLNGELKLLAREPIIDLDTYPDEQNILKWYFIVKGPSQVNVKGFDGIVKMSTNSPYRDGYYMGIIEHDPQYPQKAPSYKMLTPSGRFDIDQKICLTNSGYHQSDWSPMWNMRSLLLGFSSIMADDSTNGISHRHDSYETRRKYALDSFSFNLRHYPELLKKFKFTICDNSGNPIGMKTDEEINNEEKDKKQAEKQKQLAEKQKKEMKDEKKKEKKASKDLTIETTKEEPKEEPKEEKVKKTSKVKTVKTKEEPKEEPHEVSKEEPKEEKVKKTSKVKTKTKEELKEDEAVNDEAKTVKKKSTKKKPSDETTDVKKRGRPKKAEVATK